MTRHDQLLCESIKSIKVIRSVVNITPVEAEPFNILTDSIDVLDILLDGIGIIETKVTHTSVTCSYAEVHTDCLSMADM